MGMKVNMLFFATTSSLLFAYIAHADDVTELHRPAFLPDRSCGGHRDPRAQGLDSLRALLSGDGETRVLGKPTRPAERQAIESYEGEAQADMPLLHEPRHDCHIEVQVTERVRGYCSELNVMGKNFPVCKNGDRISINHNECAA